MGLSFCKNVKCGCFFCVWALCSWNANIVFLAVIFAKGDLYLQCMEEVVYHADDRKCT